MKPYFPKLIILWILFYIKDMAASDSEIVTIIAGVRATPGEYPWHVILKRFREDLLLCGGSVISSTWVLTVAHCIVDLESVFLQFGTVEIFSNAPGMTSMRLIIHPTYNPYYPPQSDDVGLIELPTPLTFNTFIQPIPLVNTEEAAINDFIGAISFMSGYGFYNDKTRRYSPWLLWGAEEVVNNSVCAARYGQPKDSQMCTIGYTADRQHPCNGDSGGALVWRNSMRTLKQIGIYSYGGFLNVQNSLQLI
ncbi:transmembrane protease serine 3-like [Lucilia sericata]|uniref:transmembrane protease serine 3-like n=1 Tax=Lucilia sericata TaxID=13632 RepID=UPI0018A862E7|nr:transmembrane protease serine 3-like [Lucilia sericata]